MAETLQILSYIAFVLAIVFVALAAIFFIAFDIRNIIGELSGKTANNAIAKIREQGSTRQYKGRSLQSIVSNTDAPSTDFSLDKLDLGATTSGIAKGFRGTGAPRAGESGATLQSAPGVSEQQTTLISTDEK